MLYCLQVNVDKHIGEVNKVRVGFVDPSKTQRWHLRKVCGKYLAHLLLCKEYAYTLLRICRCVCGELVEMIIIVEQVFICFLLPARR